MADPEVPPEALPPELIDKAEGAYYSACYPGDTAAGIRAVLKVGIATGRTQAADPDHVLDIIRSWADDTGYSGALLNRDLENLAVRIAEGSTG